MATIAPVMLNRTVAPISMPTGSARLRTVNGSTGINETLTGGEKEGMDSRHITPEVESRDERHEGHNPSSDQCAHPRLGGADNRIRPRTDACPGNKRCDSEMTA